MFKDVKNRNKSIKIKYKANFEYNSQKATEQLKMKETVAKKKTK